MTDAATVARTYLDTWNEADPRKRAALLEAGWNADAQYIDPLMRASDRAQIGGLVEAVHTRFPGFDFRLLGTPDGHGDHVRLAWRLGPPNGPAPIEGSDVIETRDGKIVRVIGFIDKTPAA